MKPNGRRRWRKACRRLRHREGSAYPAKVARRNSIRHWAWMGGTLKPLPAKPLTPRSLVGTSQGARKRRARAVAERRGLKPIHLHEELRIGERLRPCPGCCTCKSRMLKRRDYIKHNGPRTRQARHVIASTADLLVAAAAWRCGVLIVTSHTATRCALHDYSNHCTGSGVLPARRKARR